MASNVGYSSQESNLMDEETFETLIKDIDFKMEDPDLVPLDSNDPMEHLYDQPQSEVQTVNNCGNDDFAGQFQFEFTLADNSTSKNWVYSTLLEKIYIQMDQTLPLFFKWRPALDSLWIRATLAYSLPDHRSDPVTRCHNHVAGSKENTPDLRHVLRCKHPDSQYEVRDGHYSVRAPLAIPQPGMDYAQMYYMFCCKNSCPTGINRRPTQVIFTLENYNREILGRRKLLISICSCPKRDKDKAERQSFTNKHTAKKRKYPLPPYKILVQHQQPDLTPYKFNFTILGKDNYDRVRKVAYDTMVSYALETGQLERCKPILDDLRPAPL